MKDWIKWVVVALAALLLVALVVTQKGIKKEVAGVVVAPDASEVQETSDTLDVQDTQDEQDEDLELAPDFLSEEDNQEAVSETQLAPEESPVLDVVESEAGNALGEDEGDVIEESSVDNSPDGNQETLPEEVVNPDQEVLIGGDAVAPEETPGEVSFTVLGGNFYYDLKEIRVKEGDQVTINFRSVDGFHDWVVDEFDAATEKVSTGGETSVTFIADKKGTFEYYCSVGSHRANGMVGSLIVE